MFECEVQKKNPTNFLGPQNEAFAGFNPSVTVRFFGVIASLSRVCVCCRRYSGVFPSLNMAVKRREQTLQDYKRLQSKVEKYEEKEKTGPVMVKLHQVLVSFRAGAAATCTCRSTPPARGGVRGHVLFHVRPYCE